MSYLFGREDGRDYQGKRHLNKGGGGGGSSGVYYANQDKLLGTQADIATNMYNVYADYAPQRLESMEKMVNEAMDGTLADRARGQAAADAGTALSNSLAAAGRNIQRYGTTLNGNALSANLNDAALMGAASQTGAMNRAQQWAEGQKWARNSDMYSTLQGMPGTATQALGSAASGYGQMAGQQNQVNMANAMGYGQMGGMIGYGLMARDGGYIHEGEVVRRGDEPGYATGGMPRLADWRNQPTAVQTDNSDDGGSAVGQVAMGMAPGLAMYGMKNYVKPYLKDAWDTGMQAWDHSQKVAGMQNAADAELAALQTSQSGADAATIANATNEANAAAAGADTALAGTEASAATTGAEAGATAATAAEAEAATIAAATAEAEAAAAAAAAAEGTAATTAAATEAAAASSTLGPAGWVGAAALGTYALGSAMDWWADGGPVPHNPPPGRGLRKNMIPGGPVNGPGTETSDSIPAWLSDGEYVLNAEAVKEVGKGKLEKMNQKGLKKRVAKTKAKPKAPAKKSTGIKKPVAKK